MSPSSVTDFSALCEQHDAPVTTRALSSPRIFCRGDNSNERSSSQRIRNGYLHRLGFVESSLESSSSVTTPRDSVLTMPSSTPPRRRVSFQTAPPRIYTIPNRRSYSTERRTQLWTSRKERQQNCARNVLEFRSEQWDYRQCVEEERFVWIFVENEWTLVHPVHVWPRQDAPREPNYCPEASPGVRQSPEASSCHPINLQQHFCRVMSAQQCR